MEVQDKESKSKGTVSMGEKQSPLAKPAEKLNALANALSKGEDEDDDEDHDQAGSGHRLAKILKLLEKEIVARTEPEEEEPKEAPKDGMEELKEFFSGEEGLKRSDSFIKFAKLLTEGDSQGKCAAQVDDGDSRSHSQLGDNKNHAIDSKLATKHIKKPEISERDEEP